MSSRKSSVTYGLDVGFMALPESYQRMKCLSVHLREAAAAVKAAASQVLPVFGM